MTTLGEVKKAWNKWMKKNKDAFDSDTKVSEKANRLLEGFKRALAKENDLGDSAGMAFRSLKSSTILGRRAMAAFKRLQNFMGESSPN